MRDSRFILVAFLLATISVLPLVSGEEDTTRDPTRVPNKFGSITSDEIWSGTIAVDTVIIEEGVTVTIQSGTSLIMYDEAEFWVRGTLVVQGGENPADQVDFSLFFGSFWKGIVINDTGTADIQNATFVGGHNYIEIWGDGVTVKNCVFDRGWTGILVYDGSGHDIRAVAGKYIGDVIWIQSYEENIKIHLVAGVGVTSNVVHISESYNVTISFILAYDCDNALRIDGGCAGECGNIFVKSIMANQTAPGSPGSSAVQLSGPIHGLEMESVRMEFIDTAIDLDTSPGSEVEITELIPYGGVDTLINLNDNLHGIDLNIFDSILSAENYVVELASDTADVNITAINCRLGPGAFSITGEPIFNLSWYTNITLVNGNHQPLDGIVNTYYHGGGLHSSLETEDGFLQLILPEKTFTKDGSQDHSFDFEIEFDNGGPLIYPAGENIEIEVNSDTTLSFDLPPFNTMPENIAFQEDGALDLNYSEYFHDREENLTYSFATGPYLDYDEGSFGGYEIITLLSSEENWFGISWLNISAEDDAGNITSANITVEVTPVNDPPALSIPLPVVQIDEDEEETLDLSEYVKDPENDTIEIGFDRIENLTIIMNGTLMTLKPAPDWSGNLSISLNISDGTDHILETLLISVQSVNDPPEGKPYHGEDAMEKFIMNHELYGHITVFHVTLEEDTSIEIWINGTDVETGNLIYGFEKEDLEHGSITNPEEEMTLPDNTTEMVKVPHRFIYSPDVDSNSGDLVRFTMSDVEVTRTFWVSFNITPVNDPPSITPQNDGNFSVERDRPLSVNISGWGSDVDGDDLSFSVEPSEYITLNGNEMIIDFRGTFPGSRYNATITVSDGEEEVSHPLHFKVEGSLPPPEINIRSLEIEAVEDGWYVNVYADEGQPIVIVVLDGEGGSESFQPSYNEDRYRVFIPDTMARSGFQIIITDENGGDEILPEFTTELPKYKEEQETGDYVIYIVMAVLLLIILIVILVVITRSKKEEFYEE
jgi:hypothetical protein